MTGKVGIAVIGLGFVGLPLARLFARNGYRVIGIDKDGEKIRQLWQGKSYLSDMDDQDIAQMVHQYGFVPTEDYAWAREADHVIICVPTPIHEKEPDLSFVVSAVRQLKPYLKKGQLIVLESSTYPGTTEEIIKPELESAGFTIGTDLFLGYSPERIDPGNKDLELEHIPKIISGMTPNCLQRVKELYGSVFRQVVPVSEPKVAEFAKMLENCQRLVNISLMNEMNRLANRLNVSLWEVIGAAKTKPIGFVPYYPSAGAGGHCIPVDPYFMIWLGMREGIPLTLVQQAGFINEMAPHFVVGRLAEVLAGQGKELPGSRIGVIGLTYKQDVNDIRESASLKVISLLLARQAIVQVYDPVYQGPMPLPVERFEPTPRQLAQFDAVIILVAHSGIDWRQIVSHSRLVLDTRNVTEGILDDRLVRI